MDHLRLGPFKEDLWSSLLSFPKTKDHKHAEITVAKCYRERRAIPV